MYRNENQDFEQDLNQNLDDARHHHHHHGNHHLSILSSLS